MLQQSYFIKESEMQMNTISQEVARALIGSENLAKIQQVEKNEWGYCKVPEKEDLTVYWHPTTLMFSIALTEYVEEEEDFGWKDYAELRTEYTPDEYDTHLFYAEDEYYEGADPSPYDGTYSED
jgi:hypothetical protein